VSFKIIIPARYASSRLPGKPLVDIAGKPMIQHVYERACESDASRVMIATDDERIRAAAEKFDAEVCMTSTDHRSGTDRLAEVVASEHFDDEDIVINVQGDEPCLPAALTKSRKI
jgi:3-deoxy-manno-octulosonate cytidylyltransferase (CMP-KDO synthetase)